LEKIMLYPTIYRPVQGNDNQREAVLAFGTHGYVLRYYYDQEAETVTVLRVWHQREKKQ
jgi:plasmid stabilization system protein ParE